jgi:hypothetical protein
MELHKKPQLNRNSPKRSNRGFLCSNKNFIGCSSLEFEEQIEKELKALAEIIIEAYFYANGKIE